MTTTKLSFRSTIAAVVAGGALMAMTPVANAAMFIASFDPAFGTGVPDLGFRGQAWFYIPNSCLSQSGFVDNNAACSNGNMQSVSASVELYNVNDAGKPTLQTLLFSTPTPLINAALGGGSLIGPNSLMLHYGSTLVQNQDSSTLYQGDLWLQFETKLIATSYSADAYLYTCDPAGGTVCPSDSKSNPAPLNLSSVPEPTSVALVLAALGAGATVSRRRRA